MTNDSLTERETLHWYAFKVFYNKVFEIEKRLRSAGVKSYLPCETVIAVHGGIKTKIRRPVISSLIFLQCTGPDVTEIRKSLEGKVMLYTKEEAGRQVPSAIPDREMDIFILVTSAGEAGLEYLGADSPRFRTGDKVRVTGGQFKGAEGHICRIKGNRRLIVSIQGVCAVATSYIPQTFLEKI